jgi:hypothetical protein
VNSTPSLNPLRTSLLSRENYKSSKNSAYNVPYRNTDEHFTQPKSLTQVTYIDRDGMKRLLSAGGLNLSKNSFEALDNLFQHLDRIFRGKGNAYIPQQHSSIADHSIGVMNLADEFVFSKLPDYLKDIIPRIRAGILMHDFGELSGEISTAFQRLNGEENNITGIPIQEDHRSALEAKVVSLLFYKSLEKVYTHDNNFFEGKFKDLQQSMNSEQNQYQRFRMVETFLADQNIELPDLSENDFKIQAPASIPADKKDEFINDYKSLVDAFKISLKPSLTRSDKNVENTPLLWSLINFFDKAESEVYVSDVAIIGDKTDLTQHLHKPLGLLKSIQDSVSSSHNMFQETIVSGLEELLDNVRSTYLIKQNNAT